MHEHLMHKWPEVWKDAQILRKQGQVGRAFVMEGEVDEMIAERNTLMHRICDSTRTARDWLRNEGKSMRELEDLGFSEWLARVQDWELRAVEQAYQRHPTEV